MFPLVTGPAAQSRHRRDTYRHNSMLPANTWARLEAETVEAARVAGRGHIRRLLHDWDWLDPLDHRSATSLAPSDGERGGVRVGLHANKPELAPSASEKYRRSASEQGRGLREFGAR